MKLTAEESAILAGDNGPAAKMAMEIIVRLGDLYGAAELIPISQAHIDGGLYTAVGEAGLLFAEKLAALGQLVAGVAHELNNPLAVIMGYSELMSDELGSERSREQLAQILSQSRRMKKIVDNLLRFSRQSALGTQAVALAPVVQEVLALREYYMRAHNVQVQLELALRLAGAWRLGGSMTGPTRTSCSSTTALP